MTLYLLNLADLISTLYALSLGLVEKNPIMDFAIFLHPAVFGAVKIAAYPLFRWLEDKESYPYLVGAFAATVGMNILNIAAVIAA